MSEKIWYIKIDNKEEGPYSFEDLKGDERITPDILARKENHLLWRPIRKIAELRRLFFDEESFDSEEEIASVPPRDELTLVMQQDPSYFFWWLLLAIVLVAYIIYIYTAE
ncbi:MAG TPA: DUF4339 domain-containing protein [Waddliaceae bacterium]